MCLYLQLIPILTQKQTTKKVNLKMCKCVCSQWCVSTSHCVDFKVVDTTVWDLATSSGESHGVKCISTCGFKKLLPVYTMK